MSKTLSGSNIKDVKTTILGVLGAALIVAGALWPDKLDPATSEVIKSSINEIVMGIGALIPVLVAIFGKD